LLSRESDNNRSVKLHGDVNCGASGRRGYGVERASGTGPALLSRSTDTSEEVPISMREK
jgi:hypothetical protein